jgi:hypothetical protein
MNVGIPYRNLLMVLVGVTCLLLKRWFAKYLGNLAISYIGNLSASFAVYFLISIARIPNVTRVMVAAAALLVVESFEFTNGFGIMTNVYDPFDYLANAIGIGCAICADAGLSRVLRAKGSDRTVHNAT